MEIQKVRKNEIRMIGTPRQYRADCKSGQFKVGSARTIGKKMPIEVIAARFLEASLFGREFEQWVNIVFADEAGTVGSMMLHTESLENFLEIYRMVAEMNKSLVAIRIEGSMSPRANKKGDFFAVEFEISGEGNYTKSIAKFRSNMPDGLFLNLPVKAPALVAVVDDDDGKN